MKTNFQPVLIGSDNTIYGLARSFHMAYGKKSIVICRMATSAVSGSKIIGQIYTEPGLLDEKVFVKKLNKIASEWYQKNPRTRLLLVTPVSDSYAELVSKNRLKLEARFDMNMPDWQVYQKVTNKIEFYKLCEKYGLDYPKFTIVNAKNYQKFDIKFTTLDAKLSDGVVIKPNDSAAYWRLKHFRGYQKIYFADNESEIRRILSLIYKNGYTGEIIVQEKIEADISAHQDITTYSGFKNRKVQFAQLFQAILADNNPLAFGVFCALLPIENIELETKIAKFLDAIKYRGFAGLNIIVDPRDHKPKLLELNARLHGESYALTITGNNPAEILVNDIYESKNHTKTTRDSLWRSVPNSIIRRYTLPGALKNRALELIKKDKIDTELKYRADLSLVRLKNYIMFMFGRSRQFKKFARQTHKK